MKEHETGHRGLLAGGLGWFSIALGMSEILMPRRLSEVIGVQEHPALMRLLGFREILSGIGILANDDPTAGLWSRVAGDGMDLALLATAFASRDTDKTRVAAAMTAVAGVTALDTLCSLQFTRNGRTRLTKSMITINRPQNEVFEFWRDLSNLRQFMSIIPAEFEIVTARPNEFLEWRSSDGRIVRSGSVEFRPPLGRNGTELVVAVDGLIPAQLLHEAIRRSKRLIETGEIPTARGQSAGPRKAAPAARLVHRLEGKEAA